MVGKNRMKNFLIVLGVTLFAHGTVLPWGDYCLMCLNTSIEKLNVCRRDINRILKRKRGTSKDDDDFKRLISKRDRWQIPESIFFKRMLNFMAKNHYEKIEDGSVYHHEGAWRSEGRDLFKRRYRKCLANQNQLKKGGIKILPGSDCKSVFSSFGAQYFGKDKKEIIKYIEE